MSRTAKICRGTWCVAFGIEPAPTLDQALQVFSAFGYDGVELGGFFDHATPERFPDAASRKALVEKVNSLDMEVAGYAPGPYGDFGRLPWATGGDDVVAAYEEFFEENLRMAVDLGSPAMRVDPGDFGPMARDVDYDRTWDRVVNMFRRHAERGREEGVLMLWEYETGQLFIKPSEVVKMMDDVGDDNLKIMYDTGHFVAGAELGHNQVQPIEKLEGGQIEFIEMLSGRIGHVHLNDSDWNTFENAFGTHLGIGKGKVDFDELIPALLKADYGGEWWAADAIPMSSETWADTFDGPRDLNALLDKHVRNA